MPPKRTEISSIQTWIHRLLTSPFKENNKKKLNTVINIALNNGYRKENILHIYSSLKQQQNYLENEAEKEQKMGHIYLHRKLYTENHKTFERH
jgi:hypothetical protein